MMLAKSLQSAAGNAAGEANYIESVFQTWLYTGNGSTQTINNGIDLAGEGGLVWTKGRSAITDNMWFDTARGVQKELSSNKTNAEATNTLGITAFGTTGYSMGSDGSLNGSGTTYASWTFRKQPKFFDVVTYTGNGATQNIAHSLGSVPGSIIVKRTNDTANWQVYHRSLANTQCLVLNSTSGTVTSATRWNSTTPTSTVFSVGNDSNVNGSGSTYVAYLFAHDAGGFGESGEDNVISCGSYTGNGSATGPSINLGYEPQWVLIKNTTAAANWQLFDNMRGLAVGGVDARLVPNLTSAEDTLQVMNLTATGFDITTTSANINSSGATYIYIAIRRGPMRTPTTGTSVFHALSRSGTSAVATISSGSVGPVDLILAKSRNVSNDPRLWDRLRGPQPFLSTAATQQEFTRTTVVLGFDSMTGVRVQDATDEFINTSGVASPYINYMFRRAPGFFDEVCYTGTGNPTSFSHNLAVTPELLIVKRRNTTGNWVVRAFNQGGMSLTLNSTSAAGTTSEVTATSSAVSIALDSINWSASGSTYVAYLFASCPGVSKVGSYTGTGTTQQINCGFTGGARFVLIKRTDSTGDWYVWDSARGIVAGNDPYLLLNSAAAEVTSTDYIDTYNAGFEISSTAPAAINASGGSFIFLAIA